MYNIVFYVSDSLVCRPNINSDKYWEAEITKQTEFMGKLFQGMKTTMPCVPQKGMTVDLTSFVDVESLPDWERAIVEDEWKASITEVFVCKDSFLVMICSAEIYEMGL